MLAGAVLYVTGTHNMKAGVQDFSGKDQREQTYNGHITSVTYRSGVPSTVGVNNSPAPTVERSGTTWAFTCKTAGPSTGYRSTAGYGSSG